MQGEITALKAGARPGKPVQVHLDGRPAFRLQAAIAAKLRLGQQLSAENVQQLLQLNRQERAFQQAQRLIAGRPRSEQEIRTRLRRGGLEQDDCQAVLDRLRASELIDDRAFAEAWIENRMTFRPRGARALRSELRQKGLSNQVIARALEGFDEAEAAAAAAARGVRKYSALDEDTFRRRFAGYLSRRGFSYNIVSPLVERAWRQIADLRRESEVEP